ncbi:hypothetical protein D3C80_1678170 [compost metagenome]
MQPLLILLALRNLPGNQHELYRKILPAADWRYLCFEPYPMPFRRAHTQLGDPRGTLYSALQLRPGNFCFTDIVGKGGALLRNITEYAGM